MVAARAIKPGEIILTEHPLTFGPMDTSRPICLGCYNPVTDQSPRCRSCNYPMCSEACSEAKEHKDYECKFFAEKGFKADPSKFNFDEEELSYAIVSPVRYFNLQCPCLCVYRGDVGVR